MFRNFINRNADMLQLIALIPGAMILHVIWLLTVGAVTPMMIVGQLILLAVQVIAFILWLMAD